MADATGKTWVVVFSHRQLGTTVFGPFTNDHEAEVWVDDAQPALTLAGINGTWHITPIEPPDVSGWAGRKEHV